MEKGKPSQANEAECRFCGKQRPLSKSHIIPEWAYRPIYDDDSRAIAISSEDGKSRKIQSGLWEHMLCAPCDQILNKKFDQPFHRFWHSPSRFPSDLAQCLAIEIHGIDYEISKRFLLSVLWRAHISKHPTFSAVDLGPHAGPIKAILCAELSEDANDNYPIYCFALKEPETGRLAKGLVLTPSKNRAGGRWNYGMAFLGCYWKVYVSRSEPELPRSCRLKREGTLIAPVINWPEVSSIRGIRQKRKKI